MFGRGATNSVELRFWSSLNELVDGIPQMNPIGFALKREQSRLGQADRRRWEKRKPDPRQKSVRVSLAIPIVHSIYHPLDGIWMVE